MASVLDYLGRWDEAIELEQRALDMRIAASGANSAPVADIHRQLGAFAYYLGRYDEASEHLTQAVAILSTHSPADPIRIADARNARGEAERSRDRYESAEADFRAALDTLEKSSQAPGLLLPATLNNLAGLLKDLGRFSESEPLLRRSLELRAAEGDSTALAVAHLNLGEVLRQQDRLSEAEPEYTVAVALARRHLGPDHPDFATFLNQAGALHRALGHFETAESLHTEALRQFERQLPPGHPSVAQAWFDVGEMLEERGNLQAAREHFEKSAFMRERVLGHAHPEALIARLAVLRTMPAEGGPADTTRLGAIREAVGGLVRTRAHPEARIRGRRMLAAALRQAGSTSVSLDVLETAVRDADSLRAWRGGGIAARVHLAATLQGITDDLIDGWIEAGRMDRALEAHEHGRGRALLDRLTLRDADLRSGIEPDTRRELEARELRCRQLLASARRRYDEILARPQAWDSSSTEIREITTSRAEAARTLDEVQDAILEASPLWQRAVRGSQARNPADTIVKHLTRNGRHALLYHVGKSSCLLMVASPTSPRLAVFRLSVDEHDARVLGLPTGPLTPTDLERLIEGGEGRAGSLSPSIVDLLSARRTPSSSAGGAARDSVPMMKLAALRSVLVPDSLWNRIRSSREILVVPDGSLHRLPFEALVIGSTRFWIEVGPALAYLPSASVGIALAARAHAGVRPPEGRPYLSVSDPHFGSAPNRTHSGASAAEGATGGNAPSQPRWPRLLATVSETQAMREVFGRDSVEALQGDSATERAFREHAAGKRILHLATHGFVIEDHGSLSAGLVFAGATGDPSNTADDGYLDLDEIFGMDLKADIAILSACETHKGLQVETEGIYALTRAFLIAGCQRVAATMWPIADAPAASLVGGLLRNAPARTNGLSENTWAGALRVAKLAIRRDPRWSHPRYWAPFVLVGEP